MSETTGERDVLDAADRIERQVKPLMDLLKGRTGAGNANINVNAGGVGLQVAVLACVVQFVVFVAMTLAGFYVIGSQNDKLKDLEHKYERSQDYLNAIYQQAPQLKPKDHT